MYALEGKRIMVTGAAGFIGANLTTELVNSGASVHALLRPSTNLWRIVDIVPRLNIHLVELTNCKKVKKTVNNIKPDIIFHLAVERESFSGEDRLMTLQANVLGTSSLLEAAASVGYYRFVHLGSSLEYGMRRRPLKESDRLDPVTFYAVSKAASTLLCQQFARASRQPIVILRPFSVYGYWEARNRLIPTAITAALRGEPIILTPPGYRRDLVFVEDVVRACFCVLESDRVAGEIINVGSGQQWSNEAVVDMVQTVSGRKLDVRVGEYPARPSDTTYWMADNRKAKKLLGWEPRHSLRTGLERTIAWFGVHQEIYANA